MCIIALFGIFGSLSLPMFARGNISSGFAPMLYSAILLICGIFIFFSNKGGEKIHIFKWLLQGDRKKALIFFLLNLLLFVMLLLFGLPISMFVFCLLACYALKRQTKKSVILFSVIYAVCLYIVFAVLLQIPFDRGLIFDLRLWG